MSLASFHNLRPGVAVRSILPDVLAFAIREGILDRMRALSEFSLDELCLDLREFLHYETTRGNRKRMVRVLVEMLGECGWLAESDNCNRWMYRLPGPPPSPDGNLLCNESDRQNRFIRHCLNSAPEYLKGKDPPITFAPASVGLWDDFLGCPDFQACREYLVERMASRRSSHLRFLDLCHGPGWGVEAAIRHAPQMAIHAIDFTDSFSTIARDRAERAMVGAVGAGGVTWHGSSQWHGFGNPLPFEDGSFDAILFSCGDPYIEPAIRNSVYADIHRVLVPSGTLGIVTRGYPDYARRHVSLFWLRMSALIHDFAESVCAGWHGFSDVDENLAMFSRLGFRGIGDEAGAMKIVDSSLWVLQKEGHK